MSYDISLVDPVTGKEIELSEPHQMRGGTYALGGTTSASLNITWNYSVHYSRLFPVRGEGAEEVGGVRYIYGMTGAQSVPVLDAVIAQLGNDVADYYWEPTEGNAKRALLQLRALAIMRPDGVWRGD